MTATQVKQRRDTRTNLNGVTPVLAEMAFDTTNNRMNMGDGSRAGGWEHPNFRDIQTQAFGYGSAGGTADALTLTLTPALLAYTAGTSVEVKATATNTGAATININSLGTKNIYKMNNGTLTALSAGDIVNGGIYRMTYDGTQFQIKSLDEAEQTGAGWTLLSVATASASATLDFTSGISTTYQNYCIILENLLLSTANAEFNLRVRRSGQGSFDSGASDYAYIGNQYTSTAASVTASDWADDTATAIQLIENVQTTSATGICGHIFAHGLGQSTRALFDWSLTNHRHASGGEFERADGAGSRDTATALDAVQVLPSSGTITSGRALLYGLDNAV